MLTRSTDRSGEVAATQPIEDYALIGDTETVALVGRDGSVDWFCAPRFDSSAVFGALLGGRQFGRWLIGPCDDESPTVTRSYRPGTLVLETVFHTRSGDVAVIDTMPIRDGDPTIVRIVEGRSGRVDMAMELVVRFDYGAVVPWVRRPDPSRDDGGAQGSTTDLVIVGGDAGVVLRTPIETQGRDLATFAELTVGAGDRIPFALTWFPSFRLPPPPFDAEAALAASERWWREWSGRSTYRGRYREEVQRSLVVLKALTFGPSGGIVAAPTTSLPEWIGSVRNWDYRYCWLRDATFTLTALSYGGYSDEALAWSSWLRRAVAGSPDRMQIMYGVTGRRRLTEEVLGWLPGYEGSAPVRIGNEASEQFQLDVYGEVMDMFVHSSQCLGHRLPDDTWELALMLVEHVERVWTEPDDGIWEVRGPRRHFVHSKVMAWVAIDRWVSLCDADRRDDGMDRWRDLRDTIHDDVCTNGWSDEAGSFTQYYGATELDASLLMLPLVGFLPPEDERIVATVEAIQRGLLVDGFVMRYRTDMIHPAGPAGEGPPETTVDGLPPGEGAFLLTTFWLVDCLVLLGRLDEAEQLFDRLRGLANDVGLLSEEYDTAAERQLGNVPQAFSHVGLILSAANLSHGVRGPAHHRAGHSRRHREGHDPGRERP